MSSTLPVQVLQAGSMLSNALLVQDAADRQLVIDWGFRQIDAEYPEDPLRAPFNLLRRVKARKEWEQVIRTNGAALRDVVAGAGVEELKFQLERRRQHQLTQDAEDHRQKSALFDAELNLRLTTELANRDHVRQKELILLQHDLALKAEEAASLRRIREQINAADLEIRTLITQSVIRASGASTAEETIRATRLVNEEITRIRQDPNLTPDMQHVQIKNLLDTMPGMLRNLRPHDV